MDWARCDDWVEAHVSTEDRNEMLRAMVEWWGILREHAEVAEDWDVYVADIWVGTARIIGHVQARHQAVGHDRGLRVCLTNDAIVDRIRAEGFSADAMARAGWQLRLSVDRSLLQPEVFEWAFASGCRVWICEGGNRVDSWPDASWKRMRKKMMAKG